MASTGSQTGISIWDIPLSTANLIYGTAYIALIIGSILTAVATISLFYSSAIRDRYADASISHAKKDAAEALERAIAQDAENLKIKQRTAELEKDAALIKQQTESAARSVNQAQRDIKNVRKQLLPRRLTNNKMNDLSQRLVDIGPGSVRVMAQMGGSDTEVLARDFMDAFVKGRWTVYGGMVAGSPIPMPPTGVSAPNSRLGKVAIEAINQSGISITIQDRPIDGDVDLLISVGAREPGT